jgi:uncharacterized membrane protein YedE/YeeE
MFESPLRLVLGLLVGVVFGFLLQKGRVAKHGVIVGQLVLRDFTVMKIMLTAIAVGAIGYWALGPTEVKPVHWGGVVFGAFLFGSGLAVLGYCPGTTVAAVGEGRRDGMAGLLGMITGAFVFVAAYPFFERIQKSIGGLGKVTLPDVTKVAPLVWVVLLAVLVLVGYAVGRARRARLT